ncbi:hypothetical protein O0I10_011051 [Lichtheimia ornata]|uniref:histidine kinase n=1 Tax=Lichtheimia ornata TaxID=688661 RepID=A0AAD7XUH2_9FUNG|nr:uncharacterized protein O0I10_011051 [Lichtheimia ornata]KAJ8653301.1 hypothetical protein O0I10_011051 [Lichtheimia ornata]
MSSTASSSAPSSDGVIRSRVTEALQISGYRFTNATHIPTTDHYDNVTLVNGYRVSDKRAVVAKVSTNSLQIEREYYIIRQLYQTADGPSYLVRPLEYAYLSSSGLAVAIYADAHGDRSSNRTIDDIGTFLRLAIRCTDIMEFIHRHNTIHGQLNMGSFCWNSNDTTDTTRLWNFAGSGNSASFEKYLTSEGWKKYQNSQAIMESQLMYISPEQTGRTTYIADHRADIYSLGIIFFVLLTGQMPFHGGPLKIVNSILSRKMPAVHDIQLNVPEVISRIIEKMTCKNPEERYMSMHGVKCDLEECLHRLKTSDTKTIDSFPLAQRDIASVFMIPRNVYGRQAIISDMVNIIERFVSQYKPLKIHSNKQGATLATSSSSDPDSSEHKSASSPKSLHGHDSSDVSSVSSRLVSVNGKQVATVIGIYGPGGIGKSTLFNSIQPLARKSGYITSTKFDSRNKVPYSGLLRLMSQALQQILSETEEEVYRFFNHLKAWLGAQFSNISVLADLVPELKSLLIASGHKDENANTEISMKADNAEARLRFHNLYVEVFRAVSHWRMVTIFIDDIHQADDPSIDLLLALLLSRINILVFMSYRDQELNEKQSGILENEFANIQFIEVGTLKLDALTDFVCDTLHRSRDTDRDYVTPLALAIQRKTNGNAFFSAQLLQMLERKKIIYFNWEFNVWEYDLARIEQGTYLETMEEDVSFMVNRLKELPRHGQRLLKMASFVGDTFSWSRVKALMEETFSDDGNDDGSNDGDASSLLSAESITDTSVFSRKSKSTEGTVCEGRNHQKSYDPISGLHAVIQEGYVMQLGADEFKWSHDRITQAAGELVKPDVRRKIHFMIAQQMMQEEDMDVFLVADHLLKCLDLLSSMDDKSPFHELFIDAGNKGRQSGAHDMAFSYYKAAIQLSDPEKEWDDDNYPITLQLYTNTMGLSFVLGNNEMTENLGEIIFKHAKTPLERKTAYLIQSRYYLSQQKPFEGRDTLLACLEDLGNEKLTFENAEEKMRQELDQLEKATGDMDVDEIANITLSDDPYVHATAEVMGELLHLLYWTGQKHALSACACLVLNMCLQRGMAPGASGAGSYLAGIGYLELLKNHAAANKMAKLGVIIADRHGGNQEKAQAYIIQAIFVDQFVHHNRYALPMLEAATQHAFAAGDRHFTNYGKIHYSMVRLSVARHLSDVLPIAEECYEEVHKWSTAAESNAMSITIVRAIKALQGRTYWDTDNVYDGDDGFNDEHFLTESFKQSPNSVLALNWYQTYKIIPLTLYERYEAAIEVGEYCFSVRENVPYLRHTRVAYFYYSIALIGYAREHSEALENCLKQVDQNQNLVHEWVAVSRVNYITLWTLVEAEIASLQGDNAIKAILLYEEAINHAREGEWCLELSIAHELAGGFYYRQGIYNVAYNMIKKAVDLYTAYGAFGKSRHLNGKYADLLSSFNDDRIESRDKSAQTDPFPLLAAPLHQQHPQQSWSSSSYDRIDSSPVADEPYNSESIPPITTEQTLVTLDIIDMASILKSSQVLSSEVKSDALLKNMMQIILENSGADRGAIIVKETKFGIGAYGNQQKEDTIVTYEEPERISKSSVMVSSQIINHTIHTSESIFIPDVEQDARFAVGPWFERAGKKSVICMPIIHKMTTVGCIFLEGAIGIFTQRHITVLGLLYQQMGISLTNASLFKSVRRVTTANMKMIEMQKQALEEARRSKEAADKATRLREIFLANMSHEIRTPFSGFYGMITLLSETKLDPAQYDLVRTAKSSCEGLLQIIDDLLNFSKLQAGKVSLDLAPVHVEELIADVIDMLIAIAIQKRINVTYTVAEDVPAVVMADANRLRQIIINLLGNAVKFTHHGEISIRCSIDGRKKKAVDKESYVALLFEVIDTGIGISEEQRKVLFMPFSQVDGSTTRKYGGTGLGLSICLQLVSLMNGDIDVVSETGKGSNFRFAIEVSPVYDQSRRFTEAMQAISKSFIKTRVLVADTHHATVDMMTNFLPNLPLDGVSDYAELQQETPYGVVIVGLLLDHKEGTLRRWEKELQKIMKRAKVTVIMHYPLGTSNVQGNIGGVGPILEAASSSMEQEQQRQQQQQPFHISSYGYLDEQQNIVRMGVPLRRNKLLRMLAGFLKEDDPSSTPAPKTRPNIFARISSSEIKLAIETIPEEHRKAFKKTNVLVAEDNPVAQKLLCKQLKRYGFNITCANNGAEAIAAWTKRPVGYFKMALFDHHMPKCDGVEATKTIRRNEKEQNSKKRLPIVALTADIQDSARAICVNAGMDGYLTKPLNEFALLEFVKQYCIDR